jgi:predicted Zn-dependent protease
VGILVGYFTGDVSTLATTLMSSVVQAKYSREFEREADAFAKETMKKSGVDPKNLALFFEKMSKKEPTHTETGYFDSHPANQERIDALLAP